MRDPRIDPQPGDVVRAGSKEYRVLQRFVADMVVATPRGERAPLLHEWVAWCRRNKAEVVTTAGEVKS